MSAHLIGILRSTLSEVLCASDGPFDTSALPLKSAELRGEQRCGKNWPTHPGSRLCAPSASHAESTEVCVCGWLVGWLAGWLAGCVARLAGWLAVLPRWTLWHPLSQTTDWSSKPFTQQRCRIFLQ